MTKNSREFPYKIILPGLKNQWNATQWCENKFGKCYSVIDNRNGVWCCFWLGPRSSISGYEWLFLNEKDAILFALKWT